jgi:hypothetical protein
MKRAIAWSLFCLCLAILLGGVVWWAIAPDPLEGRVGDIRPEMSQAEVVKILGEPTFAWTTPDDGAMRNKWVTDRVIVMVVFDDAGRIKTTRFDRRPLWDRVVNLWK